MYYEDNFTAVGEKLSAHNQGHLLAFWPQLTQKEQENLLDQIAQLDLNRVDQWVKAYVLSDGNLLLPETFAPAPAYPHTPTTPELVQRYEQARTLGQTWLAAGKVGAFVVAGGQGTRLGFDGPKGNFPASPIRKKTLFRLFAESILATRQRYGVRFPWYVMTSPLNHDQTQALFDVETYFGLDPEDVVIFQQGTLPNFSFDGRLLLADQATLAKSPDGHGGSLKALHDSGALKDMARRGVEILSYWQVDNPLINIFDPLFIGLHVLDGAEMSSKAVRKANPLEKVGNFCLVNGKVTVVEYSDLPDELALRRHPDGSLVFDMGSIGIHLVNRTFAERLNHGYFSLPFHKAIKKIPYIDAKGVWVDPQEPNGVKLETFVFDALPLASHSIVLETPRAEEFGPIKNASGVDSAESSRLMMIERAAHWLETAGIAVPRQANGAVDCLLEIAPSFALCAADVARKVDQVPVPRAGESYYLE